MQGEKEKANERNVGIKIAKPFFNVNNAGDADLIFNSSWPTLQIIKAQTVPTTTSVPFSGATSYRATLNHDLGFYPLTFGWAIYKDGTYKRIAAHGEAPSVALNKVSTGTIIFDTDDEPIPTHVHFKLYNVDLAKDVEYPVIALPSSTTHTSPDFGIKFVKEGKNLDSDDMRDFILHSRCQSPLVLTVRTEKHANIDQSNGQIVLKYKNPYPYAVWGFGYVYDSSEDAYESIGPSSQAIPSFTTFDNEMTIVTAVGIGNRATIIALRDPFFAGVDIQKAY